MESHILHEIAPLGEHDFMYVADRHKQECAFPIHCHELFELNFVEGGAGSRRVVGDSSEVTGEYDLVLITSPDLEHVWEQYECQNHDIHEITIQFKLDFESATSPFGTNPFMPITRMLTRAKHGLAFPMQAIMTVYPRITHLAEIKEGFLAVQEFFRILYELSKYDNARELASSSFAKVQMDSDSRRVLKVKNYVSEHFNEDLRLEQLSSMVGMTPSAFSRFFKMRTGKNISEFIVDIRLGNAARKLVDSTDSISEICYDCGFNTLSNFNRLFRNRKGCNPTEFREKYHKTKVIV